MQQRLGGSDAAGAQGLGGSARRAGLGRYLHQRDRGALANALALGRASYYEHMGGSFGSTTNDIISEGVRQSGRSAHEGSEGSADT